MGGGGEGVGDGGRKFTDTGDDVQGFGTGGVSLRKI